MDEYEYNDVFTETQENNDAIETRAETNIEIQIKKDEDLCPICLDTLKDDLLKFKVCSHILHRECAEECLRNNLLYCPICRRYLYDRRAYLLLNV